MFNHSSFHFKQLHKLFTFKSRLILIAMFLNLIPKLDFMPNTCYRIVWNTEKIVFLILWHEVFCLLTLCYQNMYINQSYLVDQTCAQVFQMLGMVRWNNKRKRFCDRIEVCYTRCNVWWVCTRVWLVITNCKVPSKWPFEMCSGDVLKKTWTFVQNFVLKVLVSLEIPPNRLIP